MAKIIVPAAQMGLLNTINKVEGFDPEAFTTEYTDLNSNESRKHLLVMAQMAWFRLKYPEGKIAVSIESGNNCFVATARVYPATRIRWSATCLKLQRLVVLIPPNRPYLPENGHRRRQ